MGVVVVLISVRVFFLKSIFGTRCVELIKQGRSLRKRKVHPYRGVRDYSLHTLSFMFRRSLG